MRLMTFVCSTRSASFKCYKHQQFVAALKYHIRRRVEHELALMACVASTNKP